MALALQTCQTAEEAADALKAPGARYLGGGTLVIRAASEGDLSFARLLRATHPPLGQINLTGDDVVLGASVTMARICRDKRLAAIAAAARTIGGPAVRNMATVGGNLFAPAPYGDFAVALLALGATITVGEHNLPIETFLEQRDRIDGLVTAVRFKSPAAGVFRFLKVSRVKPKGVSVLSIAALLTRAPDGVVSAARIALGCMADRPMRALAAEEALVGARLDADGIAGAEALIGDGTSPITDPIASAWYRAEVLPVHFRRLLLA